MVSLVGSETISSGFCTQTVALCRVELSDDEGDGDLEGENENYICTLLDEDGWDVVNVGRRHERSLHINVTHRGNAWRTKGSGKPGGHKSALLVRIDSCQHGDNLKT